VFFDDAEGYEVGGVSGGVVPADVFFHEAGAGEGVGGVGEGACGALHGCFDTPAVAEASVEPVDEAHSAAFLFASLFMFDRNTIPLGPTPGRTTMPHCPTRL